MQQRVERDDHDAGGLHEDVGGTLLELGRLHQGREARIAERFILAGAGNTQARASDGS